MSQSNSRFNPPNVFSEMAWSATWNHIRRLKTTNIIGLYNCKIFYSTYISLISSYTNVSNTDNIDLYLTEGLNEFFKWAGIKRDRFVSDSEGFILYENYEIADSYITHFSHLFFKEIKALGPTPIYEFKTPYFMLLFEVERPVDDKEIYDDQYFYDCDIDPSKIDEFFDTIQSNFDFINKQFDTLLRDKDVLKLDSWPIGKAVKMTSDNDFFKKLVIKPFQEARCQICGDFTLREELSLNADSEEGWILPMCLDCKTKNNSKILF
jgi:hypothetical protein